MPRSDARPDAAPSAVRPYDLDAVARQADLIGEVVRRVKPQVEAAVDAELARSASRIFVTGCGDSYYAAQAARLCFDRYAGIATEPIEALEFSRYVVETMPPDALTIGISNSGAVSRTIEALVRARRRGGRTIAITGRADSPLAQAAGTVLLQTVPEMAVEDRGPFAGVNHGGSLGLGNFMASLTTLILAAVRLGVLRGAIEPDEADRVERGLVAVGPVIGATAQANVAVAATLAERFRDLDTFQILGAGPNHATAQFAAAKLFEQPQVNGVPQELEEWAHEQYFLTRPGRTVIFVLAPRGRAHDRALEQLRGARDMGATVVGVAAQDDAEVADLADAVMPVVGEIDEELSPLAYIVPGMLFATALHQLCGRPPFVEPYTEQRMLEVNSRQIFASTIRDD